MGVGAYKCVCVGVCEVLGAAGVASIFGKQSKQRSVRQWCELLRVKHTHAHTLSHSFT